MSKPKPVRQRTKNQHYTPQLHLRQFVGEQPKNMVWTYDSAQETVRPFAVNNTGAEANFYSVRRDDGSYLDDLETWLAGVESAAAAPYLSLLNGEFPTGQARMDFATFVSAFYARSPSLIRAHAQGYAQALQIEMDVKFGTRERFDSLMDRFETDTGERLDRDELFAFWHDKDRFWMEISQKRGLAIMGVADKITELLFERQWYLVYAVEDFFVTCDSPVVRFVDPSLVHGIYGDGGFKNPASEVTLPLSPKVMLLITGYRLPQRHIQLPAARVWNMNGSRAYHAERFIYAHLNDERVRALATKHKDDRYRFEVGWNKGFAEVKVTR